MINQFANLPPVPICLNFPHLSGSCGLPPLEPAKNKQTHNNIMTGNHIKRRHKTTNIGSHKAIIDKIYDEQNIAFCKAILGTHRYFSQQFTIRTFSRLRRGDFRYAAIQSNLRLFVPAFGEAILGTQRYCCKTMCDLILLSPSARRFWYTTLVFKSIHA